MIYNILVSDPLCPYKCPYVVAAVESPVALNIKSLYGQFCELNKSEHWRWSIKKMNAAGYKGENRYECFASYLVKHHNCYYVTHHEVEL